MSNFLNLLFDNYYSSRANDKLKTLNGKNIKSWEQLVQNNYSLNYWSIPNIVEGDTIKHLFGCTVYELINIGQYDEAMDLIGKSKFSSKKITAWLKALNNECEESINIANSITKNYSLDSNNLIWKLSYPLYYWEFIHDTCKKYPKVDPLFVCALIRQESKFDTNAKSISGAYGLMQLIMPTAKVVSRQVNLNVNSHEILTNSKVNILLGTHYLNSLISDWGNIVYAVASYNAGINAVKSWVNKFKSFHGKSILVEDDFDFFIEQIPYDETRNYVKNVFSNYWTYLNIYKT